MIIAANTTHQIHGELNQYNFNFNHCGEQLSKKCQKYFHRDHCFYECEPYIGPWVVNVKRSFASERFYQVPLCASDCDEWYDACKDDLTCVQNWGKDFKWKGGTNECPQESKCLKFSVIYKNSRTFCEKVI